MKKSVSVSDGIAIFSFIKTSAKPQPVKNCNVLNDVFENLSQPLSRSEKNQNTVKLPLWNFRKKCSESAMSGCRDSIVPDCTGVNSADLWREIR